MTMMTTTTITNYLAKAEECEAKAASTMIAAARENYANLARCYRELAAHKTRKAQQQLDADAEALAKRMVGRD
jgi:hypothetical protein